jgi:SH3-like domain-containing protein
MKKFFAAMRYHLSLLALAASVLLAPSAGLAQGTDTSLPIPRFVSLRSDEVNLRFGPGQQYPIEWVLNRASMPVEITQEYETWRKIRAVDGTEGWVHQRMVAGKRTAIVIGTEPQILRRRPEANGPAVARLEPGVIGDLKECKGDWCRLELPKVRGWLRRAEIWGVYPKETFEN